ncbi:hypothetical protein ATCC90586_011816 [Pythium insidiosum]|nr:hypothetical protein ATCC90586_011816 [Pythium insidiosum]
MMHLFNLREACEQGEVFVKWLRQVVLPVVPPTMQDEVHTIATMIAEAYPSKRIDGLNSTDYVMSMLYRFKPPSEFNDGIIRAVCERLEQVYPGVRHAGVPDAKPKTKKQTKQRIGAPLVDRIKSLVDTPGTAILLLPVNFGNVHWCGMIVDVEKKRLCYYDSLSSAQYKAALDDLAHLIVKDATPDYAVVALNAPVQFDGFSCGFFVCMKMWNYVDSSMSQDMTVNAINTRRFELLRFILTSKKPSDKRDDAHLV